MLNLDREICFQLREARRAAKLSQSDLAAEFGCKQSALSMFEQGQPTKLSGEVVEKLAAKFGVSLKAESPAKESPKVVRPIAEPHTGFCPNPHCPTNHPYEVDARRLYRPERSESDPAGGRFCAFCGEVLERHCPNCGAPVHAGGICSFCGEPYVAVEIP